MPAPANPIEEGSGTAVIPFAAQVEPDADWTERLSGAPDKSFTSRKFAQS
jgi:hypothetical protein